MSTPRERRVLRVAVLVDQLVCDEIHQHEAGSISMGSDYRSDVVLFGSSAPRQHTLFDYRQGAYFLDLPEHVRGKVSMGRKSFTVGNLRKRFAAGGKLRVKLNPRAKGKLLIGESTVLFQFSHPKELPPRLPFPVQFKARVEQMMGRRELSTLTASALGLGSYFTWAATAEVDRDEDFEIDERFVKAMGLNVKEEEEELPPEEEEEDALAEEDEDKLEIKDKPKPEPKKLDKAPEKFSKQAMKEARNVGIARVLGTYGGPGEGTVLDVIESTENNLGDLFAQGMTTTMHADGGAITPFVPGGEGISLGGSMAQTEGFDLGEGPALDAKEEKRERKVKGNTKATKTDVFGDVDAKGIKAQINRRTNALRYCYETVLRTRPDLAGKMTYTVSISKMGSVTAVAVEEDTVGDPKVKTCTTAKIKGWRFGTQEDSGEVTFTVVFSGG